MTPVPISIRLVLTPIAASRREGRRAGGEVVDADDAPSSRSPRRRSRARRSWRSASPPVWVSPPPGCQAPNERNPILFGFPSSTIPTWLRPAVCARSLHKCPTSSAAHWLPAMRPGHERIALRRRRRALCFESRSCAVQAVLWRSPPGISIPYRRRRTAPPFNGSKPGGVGITAVRSFVAAASSFGGVETHGLLRLRDLPRSRG